jgi:NAD(P)-dependent dehydrogenase (short-subunit alcohol dehydrogenase family)
VSHPRSVFLTGASSGIGEALARYYAARGAVLGLYARRRSALDALATSLEQGAGGAAVAGEGARSGQVCVYAGDVRDAASLREAAADFMARHGAPDVVIANAGVSRGTLTEHAEDAAAFRAVLETNVLGIVHTFQPFVAAMREARKGALVGIASVAGFRGLPGSGAYSASKAAAITYLESLRVELTRTGVAVVTICPGYIATPMTEKNPYAMPFLLDADAAARLIARAIARRRRYYVLPWQMALAGRVLRALPRPLYDALFARAPRKPRQPSGSAGDDTGGHGDGRGG